MLGVSSKMGSLLISTKTNFETFIKEKYLCKFKTFLQIYFGFIIYIFS